MEFQLICAPFLGRGVSSFMKCCVGLEVYGTGVTDIARARHVREKGEELVDERPWEMQVTPNLLGGERNGGIKPL